jgi:methionyl-tRNA formyltransferase
MAPALASDAGRYHSCPAHEPHEATGPLQRGWSLAFCAALCLLTAVLCLGGAAATAHLWRPIIRSRTVTPATQRPPSAIARRSPPWAPVAAALWGTPRRSLRRCSSAHDAPISTPRPKVVFMGTPDFAATILDQLLATDAYEVIAVYCQPPREAGRGHKVTKSAVQLLAERFGLPIRSPPTLRNGTAQTEFASLGADLAVVAAYGLLLPKSVLDAPRFGCVNVHGSILPRWRGAAPIQYAILAGDTETGVSIMRMDEGMDTGPVLATAALPISPTATAGDLFAEMTQLGASLLLRTLPAYLNGTLAPVPQPAEGATRAPKIKKEDGRLDWGLDAAALERRVRAFDPSPGAYLEMAGIRVKVMKARVEDAEKTFSAEAHGRVLDDRFGVACSRGVFRPLMLQKAGGRPLTLEDFLRGFPVPAGTQL